jgi:SPP1 gp7 family putative phage head morphogenesis protein
VLPEAQHHGVATALWNHVTSNHEPSLQHDDTLYTPEGEGWRNSLAKAVSPGPKALPPSGRVTRDWPGWRYDLQLAEIYSARLSEALGAALDAREVSTAWLASEGLTRPPEARKGALGYLAQLAWSWLESRGYAKPIRAAVQRILTELWTEGFAVGREAGKEMADSAYDSDFWSKWKPGDPDAARLAAGPGLQKLLQDYGIQTIKSVAQTKLNQLANTLADGFSKGNSADELAKDIEPILSAPQRARMIAITELARATTQAAVAEYREAGFEGKSWSVTGIPPDNRVCPRCKKNGEQGAIPMSQTFESGDEFTPGHPECRCAILPEALPADTFTTPGVIKGHPRKTKQEVGFRPASTRGRSCVTCAMWTATPHEDDPPAGKCDFGFFADADDTCDEWTPKAATKDGPAAGGLAVRARDTGRVLMIQRAHSEDDPAGGYWEFPGGRLEPGEDVGEAAKREWVEETGLPLPAGRLVGAWDAGNYRGHVLSVDSEDACPILDREKGANPDDPDNEAPEAIAWWDPSELKNNPAIRPELREHPKRVRKALEATGDKVKKGVLADLATSLDQHGGVPTGELVYRQLLENYPPESIEWVKRATWRGPYLVSWDHIDHDDMDSWAASHEPEHVDRFVQKIEAGEHVNPVVLVLDEGGKETGPDFIDVDGHHRALAYHKLNRMIRAWTGVIDPADRQAMEETHLDQIHEGASLLNKTARPTLVKDSYHGHHIAGTPFTFHHGWVPINPGDCHDGCGAKTKGGNYLPGHDAKHVKHLHEAVAGGHISPESALGQLHGKPKLQSKLEAKLAASGHDPDPFYHSTSDYADHASHAFSPDKPEEPQGFDESKVGAAESVIKPVPPGYCKDGCGGKTKGGNYLPGHDAKHISHLHWAVSEGLATHADAHEALSHSPKLQDKLSKKLGKPTGPDTASHPAPGEGKLPDAELEAKADAIVGGEPAAPKPKTTSITGTTPDGREWTARITPAGVGSVFHITAKPDAQFYADRELRFTYLGNGKVKVERKDDGTDGPWSSLNDTTLAELSTRKQVYQAAANKLKDAKLVEDKVKADAAAAAEAAKPKPKAQAPSSAPTSSAGHALMPWNTKNKDHLKAKDILDSQPVPDHGSGVTGAAAHKANVAHQVAARMKASTADMVDSLFPPGWSESAQGDKAKRMRDAVKDPSRYKFVKEYGSIKLFDTQSAGEYVPSTAQPLTEADLREAVASSLIQTWAGTSNDNNVRSLAIQEAAKEEFGLTENVADWTGATSTTSKNVGEALEKHGATYRAFLRAQYEATQEDFAKLGITELPVMRGMKWGGTLSGAPGWTKNAKTGAKIPTPPLRPLSSWTVNASTASSFAGSGGNKVTLKAVIPVKSILSWPRTGFGCLSEYEIVAFPGLGEVTVGSSSFGT